MNKRFVAILLMSTTFLLTSCGNVTTVVQESQSSTEPSALTTVSSTSVTQDESSFTQPESSAVISSNEPTATPATASPEPSIDMNYVSSLTFDEAYMFNASGYAVVGQMTDGVMKYGMIGEDGHFVIPPENDAFRTTKSDIWCYLPYMDIGFTWLQKDGLWGFVNEKCEWVVDPMYADCTCFTSFGLAGVMINGKWGFVDTHGDIVVAPTYDAVHVDERTKYAQVKVDNLWGLIDKTGKELIAPVSTGRILTEGIWGEDGYLDFGGEDLAFIFTNNCLMKLNGDIILDDVSINPSYIGSNHLFYANSASKGNGYFNLEGELVIPLEDGEFGLPFYDDSVAIVARHGEGEGYSYIFHYIDENGNLLTDKEFSDASRFASNGLACVAFDGKYGYINRSGGFAIEPQFEKAFTFYEFGLACIRVDGKYGFIDKTGTIVVEPQIDEVDNYFVDEYIPVRKDAKVAVLDSNGTLLTPFTFDRIWNPSKFLAESCAPVFIASQDGKTGLLDTNGNWLLSPQFGDITAFRSVTGDEYPGYCYSECFYLLSSTGDRKGIITSQGEVLLETIAENDRLEIAPNGYVAVLSNGNYHYVDLDG